MSASSERPERLAEILREIIALSKPTQTGDSQSSQTDDRVELFDAQRVDGIDETGAARRKEARADSSKS